MGTGDGQGPVDLDWAEDLECTRVTDIVSIREEANRELERNRAYLIVLSGAELGRVFRLEQGTIHMGRSVANDVRLDDDSISRRHAQVHVSGRQITIEDGGSSNGTLVNGEKITRQELHDGDKIRVGDTTVLKFTFHDQLDEDFQANMYDAALRDPLTKAYNKRYFVEHLNKEIKFARRHGAVLSLIIFDLDHFKLVNDTYGHPAGDQVLIQIGELAQRLTRAEDAFARYGGEEFAIILRNISLADSGIAAERLRAAVDAAVFTHGNLQMHVTISAGVAAYMATMTTPETFIEAADAALYQAKEQGRNRVILNYNTAPR